MKKLIPALFILALFVAACRKDFVVVDISNKTLSINAPANNTATTLNLVTFWWDELDGAEKYNLQVVRPDFSKAVQLLLDTNIVGNKFNYSLKPGSYQWRIKATNAGHSTVFQTFNLRIDTTSDLSQQVVNLVSPVNGAVTGNTVVTFNWSAVSAAKKYRFQINEGLVLDTLLELKTSLSYKLQAAKNATTAFSWRVKALNDAGESQYNSSYTITIDLKGPTPPILTFPTDGNVMGSADSLKWNRAKDTKYDSVYVASDSLFLNYQQFAVSENFILVAEFLLAPSPLGTYYYWRVRSFDAYGNASLNSLRKKFRISP